MRARKYRFCAAEYSHLAEGANNMPKVHDRYLKIAQYDRELAEAAGSEDTEGPEADAWAGSPGSTALAAVHRVGEQHVPRRAAPAAIPGGREERAADDDRAGPVDRTAASGDIVDRAVFAGRIRIPNDAAVIGGVRAQMSVEAACPPPLPLSTSHASFGTDWMVCEPGVPDGTMWRLVSETAT